jgi:cysteine desulfurase
VGWHYLDHAATSPARPEATAALVDALGQGLGNPSGSHALARAARTALDGARAELAEVAGCRPGEVVFTSGGTESDNLAVRGVLEARGGRAVCSAVEHHAVLDPVLASGGTTVPVDRNGHVDLDALAAVLGPDVSLVSVGLVNNELGTVQSLDAVAEVVRAGAPDALLHTDAAQALSWLEVAAHAAAADLVTLASHKCGGPVGTGALVVRDGVPVRAQQLGGGQERERRSGTQDVASALGFAAAARAAARERAALVERSARWRAQLTEAVAGVPGAAVTVDGPHVVPGIVHLCLPEVDSEAVLFLLEHDHAVLGSAAASCASGAQDRSHVLAALGLDTAAAHGALRLSFGWSTTDADVAAAAAGIVDVVARLRAHARDGAPA